MKIEEKISLDQVIDWVVNEYGELGVKIGDRVGFLYKGYTLEYKEGLKDDGMPLKYRSVGKREFGECCISSWYERDRKGFYEAADWTELPKKWH